MSLLACQSPLAPSAMAFAAGSPTGTVLSPGAKRPSNENARAVKALPAPEPAAQDGRQPDDLWERIREDLRWEQNQGPRIDRARENFLKQPSYLPAVADQADYYLYYIVEEVQKRDMPMEIALIPVIESGLNPFASGPSGAAGLWQILPETGIHLGLEQDAHYDGRHALPDSTEAALDYLEQLYEEFDEDWMLAVAAYNSGAGNVARAQAANAAKGLDTDYWSLNLPGQAREYVPKIIALSQIVADPERFDVEIPAVDNAPSFEVADAGGVSELSQAAELAGVDIDTLRALNPGQLSESLTLSQTSEILVPVGTRDRFEYNITQLSPEELVQWKTYRIKPGDSLALIARKFDTQVAVLQEANSIRGSSIHAGDTLRVPGDSEQSSALPEGKRPQDYKVCAGDSLYGIAHRFNVSVSELVAWNGIDPRGILRPGQTLKLYKQGG
jgi:membrane-bound lytic murein transglycosylase D